MRYDESKEAEAYERGLNIGRLEAAKDLAAAEERGRRHMTEQTVQHFTEMAKPAAPKPCVLTTNEVIAEIRALAPRDSGKEG